MSGRTRTLILAAIAVVLGIVGCHADQVATPYCGAAEGVCGDGNACDAILTSRCASLDRALSPSTLEGAKNCMQSGVCGVANCLARGQTVSTPSNAHATLARNFCAYCAPDIEDCKALFYARGAKLPGTLVLPYGEKVALAVDNACTGGPTCRVGFSECATETIARTVTEALDAELGSCVVSSLRNDDGSTGPGGGPAITRCTPTNCKGCCRNDACEDGATQAACGLGGATCQTCYGAQACEDGRCKEACGPNNCAGCCRGDVCQLGTATPSCGGAGSACKDCKAGSATAVCSNQTCIESACTTSCTLGCCSANGCQVGDQPRACGTGGEACVDCGIGRTCSRSKACIIDGSALWDVYVSFGVLPATTLSGGSWDPTSGAPDPYLVVSSGEGASTRSGKTTTVRDTRLPVWMQTPLTSIKAGELLNAFAVEVWDDDGGVDPDDLMGGCAITLSQEIFDGSLQSHTCPATASGGELKVSFRITKHP